MNRTQTASSGRLPLLRRAIRRHGAALLVVAVVLLGVGSGSAGAQEAGEAGRGPAAGKVVKLTAAGDRASQVAGYLTAAMLRDYGIAVATPNWGAADAGTLDELSAGGDGAIDMVVLPVADVAGWLGARPGTPMTGLRGQLADRNLTATAPFAGDVVVVVPDALLSELPSVEEVITEASAESRGRLGHDAGDVDDDLLTGAPALVAKTIMRDRRAGAAAARQPDGVEIAIGSKSFTESAILGWALYQIAQSTGAAPRHDLREQGSSNLYQGLLDGTIDIYPEYTGTITAEHLKGENVRTNAELRKALRERGLEMSLPLGFNNTYRLGMTRERAAELGVTTFSDLKEHPNLRYAFSNEFIDRGDGWKRLQPTYGIPDSVTARGMKHELAYEALINDKADVIDLYSTDAKIVEYDLAVLDDDLGFFPRYDCVFLYRADLVSRAPQFLLELERMAGRVDEATMTSYNALVGVGEKQPDGTMKKLPDEEAAQRFVQDILGIYVELQRKTWIERLPGFTLQHLFMVLISMAIAIVLAIPIGIFAAKAAPAVGQVLLGGTGVIQTVPSLAVLALALSLPFLDPGPWPAIVALWLYSLLPIVRNTYTGLHDIPGELRESAVALGLSPGVRLWRIELPLAARSILAGVKTAMIINVGSATLGALVGAGGYGEPILTGLRLRASDIIIIGLIPASLMALAFQFMLDGLERVVVSPGLRLKTASAK
jgi:osmoprotectant transport system permease protein